ncbi:protein of unknown function [Cyanobium sp. NIES-981]|nr:protein of unknown function [Cyanobium sp. NIES-981]
MRGFFNNLTMRWTLEHWGIDEHRKIVY